MSPFFMILLAVGVACAMPEYGKVPNDEIIVDMLSGQFISLPGTVNKEQEAEALNVANNIKDMINDVLENITDPVNIPDLNIFKILGQGISVTVISRGVRVKGQSSLYADILNISLLNPIRPRITYKFILPKVVIEIDSLSINLNIFGLRLNCQIRGQIIIKNNSVQGVAIVNAITRTLTDLTTIFHFGTVHSELVSNMNGVNTTHLLATILTDIVPQLLNIYNQSINEAVAKIILRLF